MHLSSLQIATEADAERFRENPDFPEILTRFALDTPAASASNTLLRRFLGQEDVFWIGVYIMGCHFAHEEGVTTTQVQAFARAAGLASPNRVVALLEFLRYRGYLQAVPRTSDRRKRLFSAAPSALAVAKSGYAVPLALLANLIGEPGIVDPLWQGDFLLECIVQATLERFAEYGSVLNCVPDMRLFAERISGYDILLRLVARHRIPAAQKGATVFFPFEEVAQQAGVSRAHVRRLMIDAEKLGFVRLQANGGKAVHLLPKATDGVAQVVSLQLASVYQGVKRYQLHRRTGIDSAAAKLVAMPYP